MTKLSIRLLSLIFPSVGARRRWAAIAVTIMSCLALYCATLPARCASNNFYLHDGDTVVFYGDSITEQLMYGRDIENYVVTRFPGMHVKFINSGSSGDRVTGGGGGGIDERIRRDVLPYKPSVVTILLGMNDGNYGSYQPAAFQVYASGMTHIVDTLTADLPGVRITLLTPTYFDYDAKPRPPRNADGGYDFNSPAVDYNQTLIRYGEFVRQFGQQRHLLVADLNAPMASALQAGRAVDPKFALAPDGVHPNEIGHLIMASAVLNAWNAPSSAANVHMKSFHVVTVKTPLPCPIPAGAEQALALSPAIDRLYEFRLTATQLPTDGPYNLIVDGTSVATFTKAQLSAGVDLRQYPSLPQNIQARAVADLINSRVNQWHDFYQGGRPFTHGDTAPPAKDLASLQDLDTKLDSITQQEHDAAQPKPHTFALQPLTPGTAGQ